ncbi:unnamed protein product [Auanema sp. JU1783]|nr:unnamed protein product [Auanema sp. JU1783]
MHASSKNGMLAWFRKNTLLLLTLVSVIFGCCLGGFLRFSNPSETAIRLIGFPGELFMNMLKAMILPLIAASLISGLSQLDGKTSGKLGSRAFMYYGLTTTHAVILGIIIVMIIHPGHPSIKHQANIGPEVHREVSALDKFLDLFRNFFPENIVRSMFQQQQSVITETVNDTTGQILKHHTVVYADGMNVLGLIMFCIAFGVIISRVGAPARPLVDLFMALDIVITRLVSVIMWTGPIGIPSLIAQKMLEISDLAGTAQMLGMFMLTVIIGLAIQCFITLPLIFFVFTRNNPFKFLSGLGQAVLTALGTSSSAASLPVTFKCLNDIGIDSRVTKFVLPVGSMINMDGTALYEAVASIFIAQMNGMDLSMGQIVTVSITATLASIGAASIPSAGLVTMLIVLTALGLPASDVSLIIAVDWFLDRLRTTVNVIGDAFGCGFVYYLCKDDLEDLPTTESKPDLYANNNNDLVHGINFNDLEDNAKTQHTSNIQIA